MVVKGKWAKGIPPRFFAWIIKDKLAVSERPGGYARNHRRVRRQEEILWLRGEGFTRVVSLLPSPHNLHAYDELDLAWAHIPFGVHDDPDQVLPDIYNQLREWMAKGERLLVHQEELNDRLMGVLCGYLRWSGLVPDGPQAITVVERILQRQMGPAGRELVAMAPQLAGAGGVPLPAGVRSRATVSAPRPPRPVVGARGHVGSVGSGAPAGATGAGSVGNGAPAGATGAGSGVTGAGGGGAAAESASTAGSMSGSGSGSGSASGVSGGSETGASSGGGSSAELSVEPEAGASGNPAEPAVGGESADEVSGGSTAAPAAGGSSSGPVPGLTAVADPGTPSEGAGGAELPSSDAAEVPGQGDDDQGAVATATGADLAGHGVYEGPMASPGGLDVGFAAPVGVSAGGPGAGSDDRPLL